MAVFTDILLLGIGIKDRVLGRKILEDVIVGSTGNRLAIQSAGDHGHMRYVSTSGIR